MDRQIGLTFLFQGRCFRKTTSCGQKELLIAQQDGLKTSVENIKIMLDFFALEFGLFIIQEIKKGAKGCNKKKNSTAG